MIRLQTINDEVVRPIQVGANIDPATIKGGKLFPELYSTMFICAKKKSGKSQAIGKILKQCVGRDTRVIAFV